MQKNLHRHILLTASFAISHWIFAPKQISVNTQCCSRVLEENLVIYLGISWVLCCFQQNIDINAIKIQ